MSKDMLGSIVRAAVGVPQDHLDLLAKVASKFSIEHPKARPEREVWHSLFQKMLEEGLPNWAYLLGVHPTITELGEFAVNYGETIEQKLQSGAVSKLVQSNKNFVKNFRNLYVNLGHGFPIERGGVVRYRASTVSFSAALSRGVIDEWFRQNKKIVAGVKEGIDILLAFPRLKLNEILPLVSFNDGRHDINNCFAPVFRDAGDHVILDYERFNDDKNPTLWNCESKFLELQEVRP